MQQQQQQQHRRRRDVLGGAATAAASLLLLPPAPPAARALTVADVTPPVAPPLAPLPAREQAVVDVFERCAASVASVFDVALQGRPASALDAEVPEGNGSGVVWDAAGHVVTNYHVLAASMAKLGVDKDPAAARGKRVAAVTLLVGGGPGGGERRTFDAELVGADKARDLAVVKVAGAPADALKPIALGDSASARVGQQVLSIGNPFGFDNTLTVGVVSALNRNVRAQTGSVIAGAIQTDAAINPGNSGGPLLDSSGRLVGINTAIFTSTGSGAGIGFAIPTEIVRGVVPALIADGRAQRAGLGATVASDGVAAKLGVRTGAMLQTVTAGGAADAAGLLPTRRGLGGIVRGDVVVAVDGRAVGNAAGLLAALERYAAGDTVTLTVSRAGGGGGSGGAEDGGDGARLELAVTLQAE